MKLALLLALGLGAAYAQEGEVMLYTSLVPEDVVAISAAFEKRHGIKLKTWRANSEKVLQRAVTEMRAGRSDADVVETNGPQMESLYREKGLTPLSSPHLKDLMPQALRAHGEWVGTRINMFVQSYNTRLVKKDELPRSFADLAHPRWKGRLGIEAEDEDWFAMVVKELGEEKGLGIFRDIVRTNGLSVRKGHTLLAGLVASGEIPLALTTYSHGAEKMNRRARRSNGSRSRRRSAARTASASCAPRRVPRRRRCSSISCSRPRARRSCRRAATCRPTCACPTARRSCRSSSSTRR